ncbi:PREDICTED: zinc finger MYM-type protein 1-like [Fragaria vesca subsp. vesca]|uniref:zinc finger MYM-type protein 1-like n=1 Tax=Fragaria vesca subsp. vesca TaxID=101020 RepID=UPI0002C36B8E|nr:PREDICTED: zinc finger MYM-type protein 1-like [Fragaria vesca subsp. vesca]
MERFFKRKSDMLQPHANCEISKDIRVEAEINLSELPSDPGLRKKISDYPLSIQDQVRRVYLQRGPCQPKDHKFVKTKCGAKYRKFIVAWFNDFPNWLEYSIDKDCAYCLCCYLFKTNFRDQAGGDAFSSKGYRNWKEKSRLYVHVGDLNSAHNHALRKCEDLVNERQHIRNIINKNAKQSRTDYRICLTASVECIRFLLRQGLAFRGHDESENSSNQGNFVELLQFLADHDEQVRAVALKNAPANLKLTSPTIQKEIVNVAADAIIRDIDNALFSILVDEARDVSIKEQMAVIFRYVDKRGCVIERFIGIVHVANTTARTLKKAVDELLSKHKLSISSLRGQGFDGASNMSGELNGLKTFILKDNPTAFYVHCFAHQLQLALVTVAKKHSIVGAFFTSVANVVNIVSASSKRRDILREKQALNVIQALKVGELSSGRGLNQEIEIKRTADTRWSSHYGTLINFIALFPSIVDVLDEIANDKVGSDQKDNAYISLGLLQSFDYIFSLHLMRIVLGISHELSQALQRDDQDIVNAMDLVKICKRKLQDLRDNGWDSLLDQVVIFCGKENIMFPNMSEKHICKGKSKRKSPEITNLHYYRFDFFCAVIDLQLQELNNHFNEGKSRTYMFVYKLITLALVLPVATATVERAFSAMNIVKNRTRNRMEDQWLNDSLTMYLEKDIFNDIDNEAIIQRFQNMATRRGHL